MSDATCQPVSFAVRIPRPNGEGPAFFRTCRNTLGAGSDSALITKMLHALNSQPPLVLTTAMERQALIMERDRAAKRMDTQQVHRLESDMRKLTNRILRGN